jgi:tetratricopeptide (TPR) repeat protein
MTTSMIEGLFGAVFVTGFFLFLVFIPVYAVRTGRLPSRYGSPTLRAENPGLFRFGLLLHIGLAAVCAYFLGSIGFDAWQSRSEYKCSEEKAAVPADERLAACNHLVERLQSSKGIALANAYWERGNARQATHNLPGAIADYTEALRIMPNSKPLLQNRANAYLEERSAPNAIADYSRLIALNSHDPDAFEDRAFAYEWLLHDRAQAIRDYSAAIGMNPKDAVAFFRRGMCYGRSGDYEQAAADFSAVIRLRPNDAVAYYFRSAAYRDLGDADRAASDLATAERLNPEMVARIRKNPSSA